MNQVFAVYYDNGMSYEDNQRYIINLFSSRQLAEDYAQMKRNNLINDDPYSFPSYEVEEYDVLDSFEKEEPEAPSQAIIEEEDDDYDQFDEYWFEEDRFVYDPHPDYVIASTSYIANETYLFPADSEGNITDWGEIGGLAQRWGCPDWESHEAAIKTIETDTVKYEYIRQIGLSYHLYKKEGGQ